MLTPRGERALYAANRSGRAARPGHAGPIPPSRTEPAHARPLQDDSAALPLTAVLTCGRPSLWVLVLHLQTSGGSRFRCDSQDLSERQPYPLKRRDGEGVREGRGSSAGCHLYPSTRRGCQMQSRVNLNKINHIKAPKCDTLHIWRLFKSKL